MNTQLAHTENIEKQFEFVDTIINHHLSNAIQKVNTEALLTYWEVGQYISRQLKSSAWGAKVVSELADYLKRQNPKRKGYGKRHLYNMVNFFETYSTNSFNNLMSSLPLPEIVQPKTAQLEKTNEIVQFEIAQFQDVVFAPIPQILTLIVFTSHLEILNRCKSNEERVFYMLYSATNKLKTEELRRCIVSQTFESVMSKEKKFSPVLLQQYPDAGFMLKDKAILISLICQ